MCIKKNLNLKFQQIGLFLQFVIFKQILTSKKLYKYKGYYILSGKLGDKIDSREGK